MFKSKLFKILSLSALLLIILIPISIFAINKIVDKKKIQQREKFARVKMVLDLLFNKKPKYLGEKIEIK